MLQFSPIFMTPGTENPQKSDASIFSNFHDPRYMKIHKNQTLQFFPIFMTLGTWKSTKIRRFNFLPLSWPQKSDTSIFSNFHDPGYMKMHKNQTLLFFPIFITPGTWKIHKDQKLQLFPIIMTPRTWKFTKFRRFDFIQFSWSRGHFFD